MTRTFRVIGISGSLREEFLQHRHPARRSGTRPRTSTSGSSRSRGLLSSTRTSKPVGWPDRVRELRDEVPGGRPAVIFASPEYNLLRQGVLKNAIDWLSRPEGDAPLNGKPAAIVGATPSFVGTARQPVRICARSSSTTQCLSCRRRRF